MDPEPVQDPTEAPKPPPEPMTMERSLSSESGSNSSLSTVYSTKKSRSASSSRSGSAASTSRSPPDQEVAARLLSWHSPSSGQGEGQGQGHAEDDQPPSNISAPSSEKEKNESTLITKADSTGAVESAQPETKVIDELQKSSDTIVKEFRHTESIMIKEAEQMTGSCCSCCRPWPECCKACGTGFCGDVAAVLCCPFTVISLLSCICFRCPKMVVKSIKSRGKGAEHHREESPDNAAREISPLASLKPDNSQSEEHHDEKLEGTTITTLSKSQESKPEKKDSPFDSHRNYFFPSPEVEDDRPGGEQSGGR